MGIGPLELNGAISRVQDFASQRHNEDTKVFTDQAGYVSTVKKETENRSNAVNRGDHTSNNQKKFDAREKGANEYYGDGGQKRKENHDNNKDKVVVKGSSMSFDMKI